MTTEEILEGQVLLIDKPLRWSSFQAVNKLKYALIRHLGLSKKFKIGHAGTLDPLATGLLIVCTGKFTKRITEIQGQAKEYTGTFLLGATTFNIIPIDEFLIKSYSFLKRTSDTTKTEIPLLY